MEPLSEVEIAAIKTLSDGPHRLMIVLAPPEASDEFMARLTAFSNFCLDVRLIPNLIVPAMFNGMRFAACPFCGGPSARDLHAHGSDCEWRLAAERWASTQMQIDREFGTDHRGGWLHGQSE